jgi:hypothetical protein
MTPKLKVSQRSDRFFGERDVSARATHLKAVIGKVSLTTIERKIMSTKTTFKRIALVAAASLGLGVLSVVPSQAAVSDIVFTATNGAATLQNGDSTTAASLKIVGTVDATDSITLSALLVSAPSTTYKALWYNFDSSTPTRTNEVVETITTSLAANAATGYSGNLRAARLTGGGYNSGDLNGDTALAVGSSGTARNLRISTAGSAYVNRTIGPLQLVLPVHIPSGLL